MTCFTLPLLFALALPLASAEPPPAAGKTPSVASNDEFLRHVPKHFATLQAVDATARRVTLLLDGEIEPKVWSLAPDAEIKLHGWWGRLDQFTVGDRVWAWFNIDRQKRPANIAMLADELTEQDIHGLPCEMTKTTDGQAVLTRAKLPERRLKPPDGGPTRGTVYVQSAGDRARLLFTPAQFDMKRTEQKAWLRQQWLDKGLPGTVTLLHPFSGEMELLLDHEAMRWARALAANDPVTIPMTPPIQGTVRSVTPWRERTQVRLVVIGTDQAALTIGERCSLIIKPPPADVESSPYPPDTDRPRTKPERIEWVLANIYCTCPVAKDTCTGHFYSLASCNVNGCGMPAATRKKLETLIDEGKTDRQIFDMLLKERGPTVVKPHLLP